MTFSGEQFVKVKVCVTFILFEVTLCSVLNTGGCDSCFLPEAYVYVSVWDIVRLTFHLTNNSQPT